MSNQIGNISCNTGQRTPNVVSDVRCPTVKEDVVTVTNVAAQNTGQQAVMLKRSQPPQIKLKPCYILEKRRTAPLTGKQQQAAKLVGKRCLVGASLGGVDTTILWDTGSQASIVGADWKRKHLSDVEVRPVKELLEENELDLLAANETDIPYEGWMGVEFTLSKNAVSGMSDKPVLVPVLVASSDLERPIIGFNVIEELALANDSSGDRVRPGHMVQRLCSALEVRCKTARAVLSVLKKQKSENSSHIARLGR